MPISKISAENLGGSALPALSGASLTNVGITVAEQWRLTSNKTSSGDITANLARESGSGYGSINAGMTESSGIFTFPSTGIWLVRFIAVFEEGTGSDDQARFSISYTSNNSSYSNVVRGFSGLTDPPNEFAQTDSIEYMFDITDTSNQKIKFNIAEMNTNNRLMGGSSERFTGFTFLRLGDT
jgi:hypothetical protein|tara:strand:- start:1444 stop:1989 length:546 start_codon:yes stop_codon:yes gene_type:complete